MMMDAEEFARRTGWSRQQVWKAARRGEVPCVKVGARYWFPRPAVEAWLRCGMPAAAPLSVAPEP